MSEPETLVIQKRKLETDDSISSKKQRSSEKPDENFLDSLHSVLNLYKPVAKTPKEVILKLKETCPVYQNVKVGYAGRLDPMARGVLLCLVGEENKKRKSYEFSKKEYIFKSVLGLSTDTYDILGLQSSTVPRLFPDTLKKLESNIQNIIDNVFIGKFQQQYPPYSSCRVELFSGLQPLLVGDEFFLHQKEILDPFQLQ
eukprot:TRINITY_DN11598_c0_g1_i2.p1 TRINITY_DN11598_c0_g1~~TRINITY_DN11598_c0_g1_i2.p1  ORF type:complete len:199 (-),score=41.36 TRINITY_DN11598_c0_g1_i2:15-611(-)